MSDPVIRRVRRSIDETKNRGGMQAGMPRVTIAASDAERLCILSEGLIKATSEAGWHERQKWDVQAENEALRAKLAQLNDAAQELYSWCVYNLTAEQIKAGLPAGDKIGQILDLYRPSAQAFILRKQAEVVSFSAHLFPEAEQESIRRALYDHAETLRQQADEAEKAGGSS